MGKKLSEAEVARYERDGLLFPVNAFSPAEAQHYRDSRGTTPISSIASARTGPTTGASGLDQLHPDPCALRPEISTTRSGRRRIAGAAERTFHAEAVTRFREANREATLRYEAVR